MMWPNKIKLLVDRHYGSYVYHCNTSMDAFKFVTFISSFKPKSLGPLHNSNKRQYETVIFMLFFKI